MASSKLSVQQLPSVTRDRRNLSLAGALISISSAILITWLGSPAAAQTEAKELRIGIQFGIGYLPLLVAEDQQLIQKNLRNSGINDTKVSVVRFGNGPAVNDAFLSRSIDLGVHGTTAFMIIWDKTRGTLNAKGLCAIADMPSMLLTNRADIQSVRDFKPEDRIATPGTIGPQAFLLRMAAEQAFGEGQHARLDPQIVPLPHPEGLSALLNGIVAAQFTSPPFNYFALRDARIHTVLTSDDVLGGPSTFLILFGGEKFAQSNPKTLRAVLSAMEQAMAYIKEHRHEVAELYVKAEKSPMTVEFVQEVLADPANSFAVEPLQVMKYAEFMGRTGALRQTPKDWKELFLQLIADRAGS